MAATHSIEGVKPGVGFPSTSWYKAHASEMTVAVISRHVDELSTILQGKGLVPQVRLDLSSSVKVLMERLDDLVPKMPASIDEHDRVRMNSRSRDNWPDWLPIESFYIHLHVREMVDDWRMQPYRKFSTYLGVNEIAEHKGETAIDFVDDNDLDDFLEYFGIRSWVVTVMPYQDNNGVTYHYLKLNNRFQKPEAQKFLDELRYRVTRLSGLSDRERYAISNDNGRVGFLSSDHFCALRRIELDYIKVARINLGKPGE